MEIPDCAICLMPINYGKPEWQKLSLDCGHCYHRRCILNWGKQCPTCRRGKKMQVITIECEINTPRYNRCFKTKILRDDDISMLYCFITELTKIPINQLQITSLELQNNTITVTNDPPMINESIQAYCNRKQSFLTNLMGYSTLCSIKIYFTLYGKLLQSIEENPSKYKFNIANEVYKDIESDSFEFDEDSEIEEPYLCGCLLL